MSFHVRKETALWHREAILAMSSLLLAEISNFHNVATTSWNFKFWQYCYYKAAWNLKSQTNPFVDTSSLCMQQYLISTCLISKLSAALFRFVRAMSVNSSGLGRLLPEVKISECGNLTEEYALVRKALERENQDFIGIKFYECSRPFFYLWSWKLWTKERVLQIFIQLLMQSWQSLISLLMHGEDRCKLSSQI